MFRNVINKLRSPLLFVISIFTAGGLAILLKSFAGGSEPGMFFLVIRLTIELVFILTPIGCALHAKKRGYDDGSIMPVAKKISIRLVFVVVIYEFLLFFDVI
ncbi:hypothetical protein ACU6RQ_19525 (plasmid) [Zobellella denitrificans]